VSTVVVIPSIGCSDRLEAVIRAAQHSIADEVFVIENQLVAAPRWMPTAWHRINVMESRKEHFFYRNEPELSLYGVWNQAMAIARYDGGECPIAVILNDDIEIPTGSINLMIEALRKFPDYAVVGGDWQTTNLDPVEGAPLAQSYGSMRTGGVPGWAFACRADRCKVDEQFEWWAGDDDLLHQAMEDGWRIGVQLGAPVRHPEPETSASKFPHLDAAKDRDRLRLVEKWNDSW
jgi:hypothetical protein